MNATEFITWLLTSTGATLGALTLLGWIFREKWKQILLRSLSSDLERLKGQLAKEHEGVRHDFQQKLEFYKVGLIAQAEEVKVRSDVKRSVATRYVEVQFERLISFEGALSQSQMAICIACQLEQRLRAPDQIVKANDCLEKIYEAMALCELYFGEKELLGFYVLLSDLAEVTSHVGPGKLTLKRDTPLLEIALARRSEGLSLIRSRIHAISEY